MNFTVNELAKSIAGKNSLTECSIYELQQLTTLYPFFGPAQFLLTRKLKEENSSLFKEHVQKASLYFQNPIWFDNLLNDNGAAKNTIETLKEEPVAPPVTEMEIPATNEEVVDQTKLDGVETQEEQIEEEQIEEEQIEEEQSGLVDLPKIKFEPVDVSKSQLTFEPYHTIDYFASQGIRPKEEEKPKDQLSRQLKSFTEWLKEMKRLPLSEIAAGVSINDEKKVEKMAEVSLNDREVVTEAMAEVWEKQGNMEKATEVYNKLSLLNPAKSSYFAAKIEILKNL